MFAGSKNGGLNFATLMTLVASCEKNGINSEKYLAVVLLRMRHIKEEDYDIELPALLLHRWQPPEPVESPPEIDAIVLKEKNDT